MAKFHVRWHLNPLAVPENPEERAKLWLSMFEMVKAKLDSGRLIDWGGYCDLSGGYAISQVDEAELLTALQRLTPYIVFEVKSVLTVDHFKDSINKAVAEAKVK